MAIIPLNDIVTWEVEFQWSAAAIGSNAKKAELDFVILSVNPPYTFFILRYFPYTNQCFIDYFGRTVGGGEITPSGAVRLSWQGQDVFDTAYGIDSFGLVQQRHRRLGYGDLSINGVTYPMPAVWDMPAPLFYCTQLSCEGSAKVVSFGPEGRMINFRSAYAQSYSFAGVSITSSADGSSGSFSGAPLPIIGNNDPPIIVPQTYQNGKNNYAQGGGAGYVIGGDLEQGGVQTVAFSPYGVLYSYGVTNLDLAVMARDFLGEPIEGMPATLGMALYNGTDNNRYNRVTFPDALHPALPNLPVYTDATGKAHIPSFLDPSGITDDGGGGNLTYYGGYQKLAVFCAEHTIIAGKNGLPGMGWLHDHNLDYAYNNNDYTHSMSRDLQGHIVMRTDAMLDISRAPSFSIDNGTTLWKGQAVSGINNPAKAAAWQIQTIAGAMQFSYPKSAVANGYTYSVQRDLFGDVARRRAFRCFRWMKVRIAASTATTIRLTLQNDSGTLYSPGIAYSWTITLGAGENTLDLDLVRGDQYPFHNYVDHQKLRGTIPAITRDPFYATFDQIGEHRIRSYSAGPDADWIKAEARTLIIDQITPGVTYTLREITLHDRTDGKRTAQRADGGMMEPGGSASMTAYEKPAVQNVLRVLANGRPIASIPASGDNGLSAAIPTFADLAARWIDTLDQGAGIWNVTTLSPSASKIPLASMGTPTPVTEVDVAETGFIINARVSTQTFEFVAGFDVTVSAHVPVLFEFGTLVEGVVLDANTRSALSGKSVGLGLGSPPAIERTVTTDDDGYFALPGVRHPYSWNTGNIAAGAPVFQPVPYVVQETEDPVQTLLMIEAANGNEFFYYVLANSAPVGGGEQDLAQDHSHGRIYRIFSEQGTSNLTVHVHEGHDGLQNAPVRAAPITDKTTGALRTGFAPSIWIKSGQSTALAAYQRVADKQAVLAKSDDGLLTLGDEMALFSAPGALPMILQDTSSGVTFVFGAFIDGASATVKVLRLDSAQNLMTWADGTTEKIIGTGLLAAGRPAAIMNRYDPRQPLSVHYGDARFQSTDGGENWTLLT
ncbi:hypothetical protein CCAX7_54470 [Capsulimonas corticalis]|uniref:Uncharacterized protein n=1 Tax=Capsulimonas corticalis TaxID=2219043 RepID=A0A402D5Y4_9BACT|nr:hypothetical protein [Capsulimonas corticalis]BDI33396.1 hypothetical protein CCAX7_54470 [Capsulimonas corticalis]